MDSGRNPIKMLWTILKEDQRPGIRTSARVTREEFLSSENFAATALVKSDTSADKTFLLACAEGVEETGDPSQLDASGVETSRSITSFYVSIGRLEAF